MSVDIDRHGELVKESAAFLDEVFQEVGKVIVGQRRVVDMLLIALLADGHVLLEGLPGLAKTLAVKTLAKVIDCKFKRIQFTPDLLPADLIGTNVYNPREGTFSVQKGPIFTNILLADEINRAPAKVQAALLEVMQEKQVTISGQTFKVEAPYMVLATQNPIEQEGTYPLPEAQTDRFMLKVSIDYPSMEEEKEIMKRVGGLGILEEPRAVITKEQLFAAREIVEGIYIDDKVLDYILSLVFATRDPEAFDFDIVGLLLYGASPRATIAWKMAAKAHAYLDRRAYVTPHDIKAVAHEVLRHRLRTKCRAACGCAP